MEFPQYIFYKIYCLHLPIASDDRLKRALTYMVKNNIISHSRIPNIGRYLMYLNIEIRYQVSGIRCHGQRILSPGYLLSLISSPSIPATFYLTYLHTRLTMLASHLYHHTSSVINYIHIPNIRGCLSRWGKQLISTSFFFLIRFARIPISFFSYF